MSRSTIFFVSSKGQGSDYKLYKKLGTIELDDSTSHNQCCNAKKQQLCNQNFFLFSYLVKRILFTKIFSS